MKHHSRRLRKGVLRGEPMTAKSEVGTKAKDKPQSKSGPSRDVPKEQEQGMVMPGSLRSPPGKSGTVPAVKEAKDDWLSPIEKVWKKFWVIKEWELSWNQMFAEIRKGHEAVMEDLCEDLKAELSAAQKEIKKQKTLEVKSTLPPS